MKMLIQLWKRFKLIYNMKGDFDFQDTLVIYLTEHEYWYMFRYFAEYMLAIGETDVCLIDTKRLKELTLDHLEYIPNERKAEWVQDFKNKLSNYYGHIYRNGYNGYILLKKMKDNVTK